MYEPKRIRQSLFVVASICILAPWALSAPKSPEGQFFAAVDKDDVAKVKEMLDEDQSFANAQLKSDGSTPLHHVRSVAVAKLLLDQGADLFALDRRTHSTPLRLAAAALIDQEPPSLDVVHYLQSKGASETDIFFATVVGDVDRVKLLLIQDPKLANEAGETKDWLASGSAPLHLAAYAGQLEIAKVLVEHGANVNDRAGWNNTEALEKAAWKGHADFVSFLLDHGGKIDGTDTNVSHSPLYGAATAGRPDCVKILLDRGAKVPPSLPSAVKIAMNVPDPGYPVGKPADFQRILDMLKK